MPSNFIDLQSQTIERVVNLLQSYKEVVGIFLMGSHAKGEPNSFSDIDIAFVFENKARPKREQIFNDIAAVYPALSHLWLFDQQGLFLYENGVRLDLDFLTEGDLDDFDFSQVKVVYDPKGMLQQRVERNSKEMASVSKPRWRDEDGDMVDWFFWMFRQVYCWTRRGATNHDRSFDKLYSSQASLMMIRDKILEMVIYLNGKWDYLNNIDNDLSDQLALTFTNLNPDNMTRATRKLLDIFEVVGKRYCRKVGKEFPETKVALMKRLFDEFDLTS